MSKKIVIQKGKVATSRGISPVTTNGMRNFFCCLVISVSLLFRGLPLAAQEEFIDPPSRHLTTIPFLQLTGGIIIMQALFGESKDTLNFVLDTGSSGISLDSTAVLELGWS